MKKVGLALLFIMTAALSFWAGGKLPSSPSPGSGGNGERQILYYIDPMTPGIRSDKPGIAPCGMPLEPVYADAGEGRDTSAQAPLPEGAVRLGDNRRQLIGVKLARVEPQPLTYTLRLYGQVVPEETRIFRLNASTDSWAKEVSDATTGSFVSKGQILAEVLAPAYYNAQVTYLISLDNIDRIKQQLGGELRHQQSDLADNQIRVAVQALQNLGIGDDQVEELARTRKARPYLQVRSPSEGFILNRNVTRNQWFKAAEEFFTIADIRKVWVYTDVYENEARYLKPGMTVKVRHPQTGKTFDAKVSKVLPLFDPISKTLKVRLDVENRQYDLRPDMFVDIEIPITLPHSLYVSTDAIIDSGLKSVVYVDIGEDILAPREVETGWKLGQWVEITEGLEPGDQIVVSGNFLIDSESRMKTAAANSAAAVSQDPVCGKTLATKSAAESGLIVRENGKNYYFCSPTCKMNFLADINRFSDRTESAANKTPDQTKDPVCGMPVNELKSEYAGWFVKLDGEPYHFCSSECMFKFLQQPKKYKRTAALPEATSASGEKPPEEPAPKPLLNDSKERQEDNSQWISAHPPTRSAMTDENKKYTTPGVIDWKTDARDAERKPGDKWDGWDKFPGSKYLGAKEKKK